eukprot:TRINITY_DN6858_c0_g1_i1.p1 TRINITY_DN6858_c0_g1~~TRINITY_DN6858_c0_g1_i1.p1  ORF type:complete len:660 (+),score=192.18 TRINITY_DN6858_c0_g1_i1:64-2043(+)
MCIRDRNQAEPPQEVNPLPSNEEEKHEEPKAEGEIVVEAKANEDDDDDFFGDFEEPAQIVQAQEVQVPIENAEPEPLNESDNIVHEDNRIVAEPQAAAEPEKEGPQSEPKQEDDEESDIFAEYEGQKKEEQEQKHEEQQEAFDEFAEVTPATNKVEEHGVVQEDDHPPPAEETARQGVNPTNVEVVNDDDDDDLFGDFEDSPEIIKTDNYDGHEADPEPKNSNLKNEAEIVDEKPVEHKDEGEQHEIKSSSPVNAERQPLEKEVDNEKAREENAEDEEEDFGDFQNTDTRVSAIEKEPPKQEEVKTEESLADSLFGCSEDDLQRISGGNLVKTGEATSIDEAKSAAKLRILSSLKRKETSKPKHEEEGKQGACSYSELNKLTAKYDLMINSSENVVLPSAAHKEYISMLLSNSQEWTRSSLRRRGYHVLGMVETEGDKVNSLKTVEDLDRTHSLNLTLAQLEQSLATEHLSSSLKFTDVKEKKAGESFSNTTLYLEDTYSVEKSQPGRTGSAGKIEGRGVFEFNEEDFRKESKDDDLFGEMQEPSANVGIQLHYAPQKIEPEAPPVIKQVAKEEKKPPASASQTFGNTMDLLDMDFGVTTLPPKQDNPKLQDPIPIISQQSVPQKPSVDDKVRAYLNRIPKYDFLLSKKVELPDDFFDI